MSLSVFLGTTLAACRLETVTSQPSLPIPLPMPMATVTPASPLPLFATATSASLRRFPVGLVYTIRNDLWLVDTNEQPRLLADYPDTTLSPDQTHALHTLDNDGDIWLSNLSTGSRRNLTNTSDKIEGAFQWWTANPNLFVFHFQPAGQLEPSAGYLSTINADGTNYFVVDSEIGSRTLAAPAPDGQTIAYDRGGTPWLYQLNRGSEPIPLESFGLTFQVATNPEWSPDGQRLAWKVHGDGWGPDGWSGVAIFDLLRQTGYLLHRYPVFGGGASFTQLAWSPDGQWLAVVNQGEFEGRRRSLWVLRVDGSEEHHLGHAQSPIWSPDGRTLAFLFWPPSSDSDGKAQVTLVDVGQWQPRQLDLPKGAQVVDWVTRKP